VKNIVKNIVSSSGSCCVFGPTDGAVIRKLVTTLLLLLLGCHERTTVIQNKPFLRFQNLVYRHLVARLGRRTSPS
jgi:hypothetical protein